MRYLNGNQIDEKISERKPRKQAMFSKFPSVPNVNRKGSAQENRLNNSAHPGIYRTRSTTLPTSWGADIQLTTESATPGIDNLTYKGIFTDSVFNLSN